MGSHVSDITPHSKERKAALTLLEKAGIFWRKVRFAPQLLCSMVGACYELLPEQHSGLDGYLMYAIHHLQDHQALFSLQYGKHIPCHAFTGLYGLCFPLRRLSPGFPLGIHNFQFCNVKAVQNLRRGLCCLPVGDNLITGHGAGKAPRLPGPASNLTTAGGPEHPSLLGPSATGAWGVFPWAIHTTGFKAKQMLLGLPCCQTGEARLWKMLV